MTIKEIKITDLKEYENNPRLNDGAVDAVASSIREFGFKVPIIIDKDNIIIAGHTRLKAARKLGLETVPCIVADDLTEEQIKAFRLADNKVSELAEWDIDKLETELAELSEMGFEMDDFGFDEFENNTGISSGNDVFQHNKLTDIFIAPPFSVLDTKQGYWRDRKNQWLSIGIESGSGRDTRCIDSNIDERYGRKVMPQQSIFDPVLCEICYRWFNVESGKIYDCFAGGSVRGIVAEKLGYKYTGIDLRQEQIDANYKNASDLGVEPIWICDDSRNADKYVEDESVDMIFSCPPYADLEVYSDDPRDISNMEYNDFCKAYEEIISIACKKLKPNRFAVFVVGDIRDKNGYYRNFVDYTKECFNKNGLLTYNDIVLLDMLGTAMIRCKRAFNKSRKLTKVHQNVIVFFKGQTEKISEIFPPIDFSNLDQIIDEENIEYKI